MVGLSGGPDSVALLDAFVSLSAERRLDIVAAHLDHGLRPDSAGDAAFCEAVCRDLGVVLRRGTADVKARAKRDHCGVEDAARRERYAFLRSVAEAERASFIAVGHNRDDQAETVLLRLLRGAGAKGLSAMRPQRGPLLRPLLEVSRGQILAHLKTRGLRWREDPSNLSPRFTRNRVRHELLPLLESFNPRIVEALARAARLLAADEDALQTLAAAFPWTPAPEGGVSTPLPLLRSVPAAVVARVLRRGLEAAGGVGGAGASHVETLVRLTRSKTATGRRVGLPGGREAVFTRESIFLLPAATGPRARSSHRKGVRSRGRNG